MQSQPDIAGAATGVGAFIAAIPIAQINMYLGAISLVLSIVATIYSIRRNRKGLK